MLFKIPGPWYKLVAFFFPFLNKKIRSGYVYPPSSASHYLKAEEDYPDLIFPALKTAGFISTYF